MQINCILYAFLGLPLYIYIYIYTYLSRTVTNTPLYHWVWGKSVSCLKSQHTELARFKSTEDLSALSLGYKVLN